MVLRTLLLDMLRAAGKAGLRAMDRRVLRIDDADPDPRGCERCRFYLTADRSCLRKKPCGYASSWMLGRDDD